MSLPLSPGVMIPIPCRSCCALTIPFTLQWGSHLLTCPGCGGVTGVDVQEEEGLPRIRTHEVSRNASHDVS